ncbi:response regulator transcription factor [Pseudomonas putida CSV86]|uniref:Response regulator transcription factor n=1 Tax=Pseudomonas bharatica CSV86 TaxID=1005395 RepID=L1M0F6_9PSED|nr:response regulator transcription factor [Pseudomonas bharatica]NNJ18155.1 response regulator transcription factor [Pseudomonas bharatica CSV86]
MNTVLLFSDSQATTPFTMTCLMDSHFQATQAHDLQGALKLLKLNRYELVVADLHLRSNYRELVSCFYPSASLLLVDLSEEQMARASGAGGVLARPFLPCELLAAIHKQINRL